jgi:hypothetical protein
LLLRSARCRAGVLHSLRSFRTFFGFAVNVESDLPVRILKRAKKAVAAFLAVCAALPLLSRKNAR